MRAIEERELDARIGTALRATSEVPKGIESALFAAAEGLLQSKRERTARCEAQELRSRETKLRRTLAVRKVFAKATEILAFYPQVPATAVALVALLFSIFSLRSADEPAYSLTYADLPALPKNNDFSAVYDANYLAERQAYEREVADAHRNASGGI